MFLFFHINAHGQPKKWNRPASDTFNWPRLVQIAWQLYDKFGKLHEAENFIIYPEGFEIPYESERLFGISTERAREEGTDLEEVLRSFAVAINKADYIIAHNLTLAANVVGAEFIRKDISHNLFNTERFSLMAESTYFCKIPGKGGRYKWPSLTELYIKVFGSRFEDPYNSEVAVQATANCFFKLVQMEELDLF